jgi:hypothetical protein
MFAKTASANVPRATAQEVFIAAIFGEFKHFIISNLIWKMKIMILTINAVNLQTTCIALFVKGFDIIAVPIPINR